MGNAKPFDISKHVVCEAYKRVKANKGAAGIDDESISDFEEHLKDNLYKIWNRMSSGSYFPPSGQGCRNTQKDRRHKNPRGSDRSGSNGPNGCQNVP